MAAPIRSPDPENGDGHHPHDGDQPRSTLRTDSTASVTRTTGMVDWALMVDAERRWSIERERAAFDAGFRRGYDARSDVITAIWTGVSPVFALPRQDELKAARAEVIVNPCTRKCRKCSRCIRYESWFRNGRRDYAGQAVIDHELADA